MNHLDELRRKGLTHLELWKKVLNSPTLLNEYQRQNPEFDLDRAKTLVSLCSQIKSEDGSERYVASEELSKMKAVESVPALLEALKDSNVAVKETALNGLFHIGGEEVIAGLEAIEEDDSFFYEGVKLLLRELKNEKILPSLEFFEKHFLGHSWRIIEEDELLYKVEVIYESEKKKRVFFYYKENDIFLSRVLSEKDIYWWMRLKLRLIWFQKNLNRFWIGLKMNLLQNRLISNFQSMKKRNQNKKKEIDEDEIKKYSDKLLKNPSSWFALFGRGCALLKKGEENTQKHILCGFWNWAKFKIKSKFWKIARIFFRGFPELKA